MVPITERNLSISESEQINSQSYGKSTEACPGVVDTAVRIIDCDEETQNYFKDYFERFFKECVVLYFRTVKQERPWKNYTEFTNQAIRCLPPFDKYEWLPKYDSDGNIFLKKIYSDEIMDYMRNVKNKPYVTQSGKLVH